jgi:phosphopentomutase
MVPLLQGSDPLTSLWELSGLAPAQPFPSYRDALPASLEELGERAAKVPVRPIGFPDLRTLLGQSAAEAVAHKQLLIWGDQGAACHIAAHDSVCPPPELFRVCRDVRKAAQALYPLARVAARPIGGLPGAFRWLDQVRESCTAPPGKSLFEALVNVEQLVTGIGKVGDLFNGNGFTRLISVRSTATVWSELMKTLTTMPRGLIVAGVFDDVEWGGTTSFVSNWALALERLDAGLLELQAKLKPGDLVCLTADHARDVLRGGQATSDHVPVLMFGPRVAKGVNLGTLRTFADLGQTIAEAFGASRLPTGDSYLAALRGG